MKIKLKVAANVFAQHEKLLLFMRETLLFISDLLCSGIWNYNLTQSVSFAALSVRSLIPLSGIIFL